MFICPINKLLLFITLSATIPWRLYKTDSCCNIKNTSVETSAKKVLHSTLYTYMRSLEVLFAWQSLLLFSVVNYSGILFTGSKSTYIWDKLLPHRGRYGIRHHSCMQPLYRFSIWEHVLLFCFYNGAGRTLRSSWRSSIWRKDITVR
jgi:hypothetical protein